jgi:microcompartment protein CcmK/EutM
MPNSTKEPNSLSNKAIKMIMTKTLEVENTKSYVAIQVTRAGLGKWTLIPPVGLMVPGA